jgi:hypothetical protein
LCRTDPDRGRRLPAMLRHRPAHGAAARTARVVYYLRSKQGEIWLLTLYAKNEAESISGPILKKIKEEIDG